MIKLIILGAVLLGGLAMTASWAQAGVKLEKATFAGGCFWCMVAPFELQAGVKQVISGYMGGTKPNPTYEEVSTGSTGYVEAVQIVFDPAEVSYSKLVEIYWHQIDPTDSGGQFVDRGTQYHTIVFYADGQQKLAAEKSKQELEKSGKFSKPVVTELRPATTFYAAEAYHQDYYKKSPLQYAFYRTHSGREQFLEKNWPKTEVKPDPTLDKAALKKKLTPLQYQVTQEEGTEPAFHNEYWNNHKAGLYVDIVTGVPLFSSQDKFDSGTGWPSFTKPLDPGNIVEKSDRSLLMERTEVKSKQGGSHLGHVFPDGPAPTGQRYCINSAALRFIPKENLEKAGYGKYLKLFQ